MNKSEKKLIALLLTFLVSSSIIPTVSALNFENDCITDNLDDTTKKVVTLYKYGLDGSISTIKIEIDIIKGQDINDIIEKKCIELLLNDMDLGKILNNNITQNTFSFIKSRGRGLHIKLLLPTNNKILQLLSSDNYRKIRIPIIYCRYPNDANAFTTTKSILNNSSNTTTGPHSVLCIGFYGFKWWLGRISLRGFFLRTGFIGFSIYTRINNL